MAQRNRSRCTPNGRNRRGAGEVAKSCGMRMNDGLPPSEFARVAGIDALLQGMPDLKLIRLLNTPTRSHSGRPSALMVIAKGGSGAEVKVTDRAIDRIGNAPSSLISFQWLRSSFKVDHNLKDSLGFGHAVIDEVAKLDQYLYTYGPMIESQWNHVTPYLHELDPPTVWIDYGCGQGLAGLLVNDLTHGSLFKMVQDILLIEPSDVALARAGALYRRIAPAVTVSSVCKRFDELGESDIPSVGSDQTLHLFSNSLDIPGFDPLALLAKTMKLGRHTILSVSHDRNFNGGTPQIERVRAAVECSSSASTFTIHRSTLDRFTCDNPNQSKGVIWLCELEIKDG